MTTTPKQVVVDPKTVAVLEVTTIGPKGEEGVAGPTGPPGPVGPDGLQGPIGLTGATGVQGPQGDTGQIGDVGPEGPMGLTGPTGPPGDTGATGDTGAQGLIGPQGPEGPEGPMGPRGYKGDTGDPGGPVGPQGPEGPQGVPGPTGLTGPEGPQGVQGVQGDTGNTGATGSQGVKGDTGDTGPQGPQGLDGPAGPKGDQGIPGASGGTVGPPGGSLFTNVAAQANLPAAASSTGLGYYVTGTKTAWISDGVAWRLVYGDTLNRDISSLLDPGFKLAPTGGGHIRLRRIANWVYLTARLQRVNAGGPYNGSWALFAIPAGFVPNANSISMGTAVVGAPKFPGVVDNLYTQARCDVMFAGLAGAWLADEYMICSAQWVTDQTWPTTLPGVAGP